MFRLLVRFFLFLQLSLFVFVNVHGQNDYTFTHYNLYDFAVFPAATGVNYYPSFGISYHNQWGTLSESPQTFIAATNFRFGKYDFYTPKMMLNKSTYLTKERVGVGFLFESDRNGPLSTIQFQTSYAYHLPFEWATTSLGMDLSYNEIKIDYDVLLPTDPNDPELIGQEINSQYLQAAFGMQLTNELFFLSIAARNLINNKNLSTEGFYRKTPDYYVNAGFTFPVRKGFRIEPAIMVVQRNSKKASWCAAFKTYLHYNNWISLNYFSSGILEGTVALRLIEQFQVGYGYAYYLENLVYGSYGAHSIFLGRNFGLRNLHGIRKNVKQLFL